MKLRLTLILSLVAFSSACSNTQEHTRDTLQSAPSIPTVTQKTYDLNGLIMRNSLIDQISDKRAIIIGEVHDRLEHHQNQLRIIKGLYERNPDLVIGVEYLQQPFQRYLDDYIAGRIDEREMLIKAEYFKRWQVDFRVIQPIFAFARENHIPILALNIADEIHNKVFKSGIASLGPEDMAQIPADIQPASQHYLQRLKRIFDSHPVGKSFENFVEGVLLWDESMADTATRYLQSNPKSQIVVLSGLVHVLFGDGIPERIDRRLGSKQTAILINGVDFDDFPDAADFQLVTQGSVELPKSGRLGISIMDGGGTIRVTEFTTDSAAQATGIQIGDRIVSLDGVNVGNIPELKSLMFDREPGELIQVGVQRNAKSKANKTLQFDVVLR